MNYIDGEVVLLALIMFCAHYAMGWRREWTKFLFAEFLLMRISFLCGQKERLTDKQINILNRLVKTQDVRHTFRLPRGNYSNQACFCIISYWKA